MITQVCLVWFDRKYEILAFLVLDFVLFVFRILLKYQTFDNFAFHPSLNTSFLPCLFSLVNSTYKDLQKRSSSHLRDVTSAIDSVIFVFKMAVQRIVISFYFVILCTYCINVSSVSALSHGHLSGMVACKTYNTSRMDCSRRNLVVIPILDRNLTTVLDLSQNLLQEIHGAPFKNLTILLSLNLSYSEIFRLNYTVFRGLNSLEVLDLQANYVDALPRYIFSDLSKLIYCDLRGNPLFYIPRQTLATLYSLQYLYVTNLGRAFDMFMSILDNLTKVEDLLIFGLYSNVTNATIQPLAGLPIHRFQLLWVPFSTVIPRNFQVEKPAFTPLTSITELCTDFVALAALRYLHSPLQILTLASYVEEFPYVLQKTTLQVLSRFEVLTFLKLVAPNLYEIENDAFTWIPNLTDLIFFCKLQILNQYSFRGLTALKTLDIHDNQFTAMPSEALNVLGKLSSFRNLDLSLNSISTIADDAFSGVSSLTYLNIGNNQFKNAREHTRWLNLLPNLKNLVLGAFEVVSSYVKIDLPNAIISLQTFEIRDVTVEFTRNFCPTFPNSRSVIISNAIIIGFPVSLSLSQTVPL